MEREKGEREREREREREKLDRYGVLLPWPLGRVEASPCMVVVGGLSHLTKSPQAHVRATSMDASYVTAAV